MKDTGPDTLEMLTKYVRIVGDNEGVHFLYKNEWSDEEWALWKKIITKENGWIPLDD